MCYPGSCSGQPLNQLLFLFSGQFYWERCSLKIAEQRKDKQKSDNPTLLS